WYFHKSKTTYYLQLIKNMWGEASGLNSAVRQLGSALGTTILGTVFLSIVTSTMTTNINESDILSNDIKTELIQSVQASSGFW
ncbi:MAG: hypothetical protein Q9M91_07605, partial [Candidatus Dojkabacteria bacterium]|nr:hypothetical protein [Candidatus Dojkabacteria bacterium]